MRVQELAAPDGLPYTLRIVLENLLRHGRHEQAAAPPQGGSAAVELQASRLLLHDTNGVPLLADLAAMRDAMARLGGDPALVRPHVPADLVVDHSVIADVTGRPDARERNIAHEYERNAERYRFLRWGRRAFDGLAVIPPGTGIMHQVNVEHLARVVMSDDGLAYPDVCLGTDSHTTMVNGLGVLGWGIGGIEAEAVLLGEPVSMPLPPVVGVHLRGRLPAGATTTDLVLTITERLRRHGVVGTFVEFSGPGVGRLPVTDRVTIANMSPEFGSTCAYFPIDEETLRFLRFTGRSPAQVALVEAYARKQGLWHDPDRPIRYAGTLTIDLGEVEPSIAGPRRPQDRIPLRRAKEAFRRAVPERGPRDGRVAIAAITSCTNTSNPSVMVAAGLLARNAVHRGLSSRPWVKTSLSPGSTVVTAYLDRAGLTPYLEKLGFHLAGYGCMTCIGGSGPLLEPAGDAMLVSVLSGNRNFDGRINPDVRMNYLASPPLVVAYAIAGTMDVDPATEPLGAGADGTPVYLRDLWPSPAEVQRVVEEAIDPGMYAAAYADVVTGDARWRTLDSPAGPRFAWDDDSTYLRRPPFLDTTAAEPAAGGRITGAKVLLALGDSVTTDHISPAGAIPPDSPAGRHLRSLGVDPRQLNTYASRRGNHEVMMRGAFANPALPGWDAVFDRAAAHRRTGTPLIVLAGREYGTGSSRDWAAKGPALLGVRAVLAESYERIHRQNLVGMGILPLQFRPGDSAAGLGLTGAETFDIDGSTVTADGRAFPVTVRLDTPREADYHRHGGILPYVLRSLLTQ